MYVYMNVCVRSLLYVHMLISNLPTPPLHTHTPQAIKKVTDESGTMALFTRGLDVTLIGSFFVLLPYFTD